MLLRFTGLIVGIMILLQEQSEEHSMNETCQLCKTAMLSMLQHCTHAILCSCPQAFAYAQGTAARYTETEVRKLLPRQGLHLKSTPNSGDPMVSS